MRRIFLILVVAAMMALTMMVSASPAFAQGHPSCFGTYARSEPGGPGPGSFVSAAATEGAGEPGSPALSVTT